MRRRGARILVAVLMGLGLFQVQIARAEGMCTVRLVDLVDGRIVPLPEREVPCTQTFPVASFGVEATSVPGVIRYYNIYKDPPQSADRFDHYWYWVYTPSLDQWSIVLAETAEEITNGTARRVVTGGQSQQLELERIKAVSEVASEIRVKLNGEHLNVDPAPFIDNSRTLIPMRAIFEAMGASIKWDPVSQTVTGTRDGVVVKLVIGSDQAWVNGQEVILDVPAKLVENRTFVPARFVAETMGAKVEWDGATETVLITDTRAPGLASYNLPTKPIRAGFEPSGETVYIYSENTNSNGVITQVVQKANGRFYLRIIRTNGRVSDTNLTNLHDLEVTPGTPADGSP